MLARSSFHERSVVLFALGILLAGCWLYGPNSNGSVDRSIRSMALQGDALWLCGPARLDRFNLFDNSIVDEAPPSFSCGHLFVARNGWIWAYRDIVRFNDGKGWHDPKVYYSGRGSIYAVSETSDNSIWISSNALSRYDPQTSRLDVVIPELPPTPTSGPSNNGLVITQPSSGHIGPVFEAADGAIWFNDQFRGIVRWDRKSDSKQFWGPNDGFDGLEPIPTKFIEARDRSIWVGTLTGAYRFHDNAWQSWKLPEEDSRYSRELNDFWVFDMLEDQQGRIWVVFARAGVMVWDGSQWNKIGNLIDKAIKSRMI